MWKKYEWHVYSVTEDTIQSTVKVKQLLSRELLNATSHPRMSRGRILSGYRCKQIIEMSRSPVTDH